MLPSKADGLRYLIRLIIKIIHHNFNYNMASKPIERLLIYLAKSFKVNLLSHAHVQLGIASFNAFENTGEKKLLELLSKRDLQINTIFDVGGNDGSYSILLSEIFPKANIYCFEPVPGTYKNAEESLKDVKNVSLQKFGLYKENCTLDIYNDLQNPNDQISTVYPEGLVDFYTASELQKLQIEVKTLDSFCSEQKINTIDFLKIDVEGAELNVLEGAKDMLSKNAIRFVQFEFNDFNISSRTFMKDFYKTLKDYNFFRITGKGLVNMGKYKTELEIFKYQNILAVNPTVSSFKITDNINF